MVKSFVPGQEVGKRLLPQAVDFIAQTDPKRVFLTFHTGGDDYRQGWEHLNFEQLAKAVDWTAWWIQRTIGTSTEAEVLAYMGTQDVRYSIFTIASLKTGHATLLPSPRNAIEGHLHLIRETKCRHLVYSKGRDINLSQLQANTQNLQFWEIPSLYQMLHDPVERFSFTKEYEDAENEVAVIIHSSGSTGLPKLIPMTNGYLSVQDNFSTLPELDGDRRAIWSIPRSDERSLCVNPLFHLMGFYMFQESIFHGLPTVMGPDRPMTAELLIDIILTTSPTIAVLPPSLIEDMSRLLEGRKALSLLRTIISGGAPLSPIVAHRVAKLTRLCTAYGTSEICLAACMIPEDPQDYQYLEFHPSYGLSMDPVGEEDLYEAVVYRREDRKIHAVFHSFPDLKEYRTNDLFTKHPSREGLWLYHGRRDDVLVLSNGEKFNPINLEKHIEEHPLVNRALVVGQAKFQAAVLVEPDWDKYEELRLSETELIDQIWPVVEEGNQLVPSHGQIWKTFIKVSVKGTPFKTTPKGSIRRQAVVSDYADAIENLYAGAEQVDGLSLPEGSSLEDIQQFLKETIAPLLPDLDLSATSDFFSSGLDSLRTLQLTRLLQGVVAKQFPSRKPLITVQKLYKTPTLEKLAQFLANLLDPLSQVDAELNDDEQQETNWDEAVQTLVKSYSANLPTYIRSLPKYPEKHTVFLTGSTGYIGSFILNQLLQDSNHVEHVFCLNRSASAYETTKQSFQQRGLDFSSKVQSRVTFLQAQFGEDRFGLDTSQYSKLQSCVSLVIHNAWKVDFNHPLESFEDTHIQGTRRLINFVAETVFKPHIIFISSLSAVGRWDEQHGPSCPEVLMDNTDVVLKSGYGLSKYTAECILANAAEKSGLPITIIRVGQIGGPSRGPGFWNKKDWVPAIVLTSKAMSKVPDSLSYMPIDWVPVDLAAKVIWEFAETRIKRQRDFRSIHRHFAAQVVTFPEWVDFLSKVETSDTELEEKPALKLLDFLKSLAGLLEWKQPPWETKRAEGASATLRDLPAIDENMMDLYLTQWGI
ncbi:hypothetical protein H2204_000411 [Knufia peltigerae]|uniref:Carrier domain-containing protein n=1 Tax=Knufia peltigerae TaxID=1002370 RepID=A0AA38YEW5_9EURO|nr:hypothetical protein H2204_000411 [Knufia peltigerae]